MEEALDLKAVTWGEAETERFEDYETGAYWRSQADDYDRNARSASCLGCCCIDVNHI